MNIGTKDFITAGCEQKWALYTKYIKNFSFVEIANFKKAREQIDRIRTILDNLEFVRRTFEDAMAKREDNVTDTPTQ